MLQEKEKLRRMVETEIERLKEELHQQKDQEDRARRQLNQKLKQKTDDFDHLHRDYKHLDTEHKKQQKKMAELRQEIHRAETALADERAEKTTLLEEAACERMELHKQHYEEKERETMTLQRMQSTYQNQLSHYREQETSTTQLIEQLKDERQAVEDKSKMGFERISFIVQAWRNQTKCLIEDNSLQWWPKWGKHTAEL